MSNTIHPLLRPRRNDFLSFLAAFAIFDVGLPMLVLGGLLVAIAADGYRGTSLNPQFSGRHSAKPQATAAQPMQPRPTASQPVTSQPIARSEVDSIIRLCAKAESTGMLSAPCDYSVQDATVTLTVDMAADEAQEVCPQVADLMHQQGDRFDRDWKLQFRSSYSATTIAHCSLKR